MSVEVPKYAKILLNTKTYCMCEDKKLLYCMNHILDLFTAPSILFFYQLLRSPLVDITIYQGHIMDLLGKISARMESLAG